VASPSYLRRHGDPKTVAELAGHAALSSTRDAAGRWALLEGAEVTRVRMNVRLVSNFGDLLRELAIDGLGVALLPSWYVEEPIREKRLRRLLPSVTSEPVVVHALYRAVHRGDPRVRLFVEHLRTAYPAAEDPRRFGP
jgi:DNA-binding transcriptional LysR family regulator